MAAFLVAVSVSGGAAVDYLRTATEKIDAIQSDRVGPGSRVELTPRELNAWAQTQVPGGVREAAVRIDAPGVATGTAVVDFVKVCRAEGYAPGWPISKLLKGEHPVSVTARIRSAAGTATVDVTRVEIAGLEIDGATLDLLIQHVLLPLYPNASVGRPFELRHHIERLDVKPEAVGVVIAPER